jgi:ribonuclease G
MSETILINVMPQEVRVGVVQNGTLQELHIERSGGRGLVGDICLGRVTRVLPGMQSAFVDIGLERSAFLHVADVWQASAAGSVESAAGGSAGGSLPAPLPIERLLHEGDRLMVQIIKDPIGTKGARLSTHLSIAGRFLVYLPLDPHIGVSQRIDHEGQREALRSRVQAAIPAGERGGFIARTIAEEATDAELSADVEYLRKRWKQILEGSTKHPPPVVLCQELSLSQRVVRDLIGDHTQTILVDSAEAYDSLLAFALDYMPSLAHRLARHQGDRPICDLHGIEDEIGRAIERKVSLKSGGYLIIDPTEALTTIDVNTGGFVGGRSFDDTIFKTNLEAAQSIARQMRLRNLGGIIIIDFIDMHNAEHREAVLAELGRALAKDRTRTTVSGFTSLGLVEVTRKRTRESLAQQLCEPCKVCHGRGSLKTARTVCYVILREIDREARQFNPKQFRIVASQAVVDLFLDDEAGFLATLTERIGRPVALTVETIYSQEQYDIVLM